ncbi:XrtX-associated membrane protein [Crocinitomix algicola]|uniref:XrtX-associated membrane protein n=1 Tax=Crocinitomix algicola TaxID=1740263 RepID=UPI00082DC3F5|nr:hypothetical protein [Crocinitomix algicola]
MSRKVKVIILTLLIVNLGFLRGYLFYNINWIYATLTKGRMNQARYEFYFFLDWTPGQINVLKWILTFLFTFLFFYLTYWIVKLLFNNPQFNKIVIYSYVGLLAISALFYSLGLITGKMNDLYGVVRTVMGIAQSFMPFMILVLLFRFFPQGK